MNLFVPVLSSRAFSQTEIVHTHTHASESIRFSCKYRAPCALAPEQSKAGRLFGIATYNAVLFRGVWLGCQLLTLTARARYLDETLVRVATFSKCCWRWKQPSAAGASTNFHSRCCFGREMESFRRDQILPR